MLVNKEVVKIATIKTSFLKLYVYKVYSPFRYLATRHEELLPETVYVNMGEERSGGS